MRSADGRLLVTWSRYEAAEFRFKYGYDIPVSYLAKRVADLNQVLLLEFAERETGCKYQLHYLA
jgi:20S proteasome subunit alpha 1